MKARWILFGCGGCFFILALGGCSARETTRMELPDSMKYDTVRAGRFDTGKMWTFDFPPVEYFAQTYNFTPSKEWFDKARLAALRLPNCSASFVSEDGLVMTNHHCARSSLDSVTHSGERLAEEGFYAQTLADERKVPGFYIDQLRVIEDVTAEIQEAFDKGATDKEKIQNRINKISEIQRTAVKNYKETAPTDSMVFNIIAFYNGGRYSLYGYKRYTEIKIVYAPEEIAAFFGGDPDNFTYPRYDFDCAFFRIYDHGVPLKTSDFFKFSPEGAKEGDATFVIGNPGSTSRLETIAQIQYLRDYAFPIAKESYGRAGTVYAQYVERHPDSKLKYLNTIFGLENSRKALTGFLDGLLDPTVMAKKRDFENTFKSAVNANPELKRRYGDPWTEIEKLQRELNTIYPDQAALTFRGRTRSQFLSLSQGVVDHAFTMKGAAKFIPDSSQGIRRDSMEALFYPASFNPELEKEILVCQLEMMARLFNGENKSFKKLLAGRSPRQAADELAEGSVFSSKEKFSAFITKSPAEILASSDPLIAFAAAVHDRNIELRSKASDIQDKLQSQMEMLGEAMYRIYGTKIPPDATFTLRIADGVVKGYEYNGTLAPPITTFYGLYDRYFSFGRKSPWKFSSRWENPPPAFTMSTPMDFVSTNDIIGGNSGSPVVNKDLQIVGLVFDGNMESLPGDVIFDETKNRSIAVHSAGLLEGLDKIYKAERLVKELRAGKISQ